MIRIYKICIIVVVIYEYLQVCMYDAIIEFSFNFEYQIHRLCFVK